ncbi:uncharacterized protein BX664DRAFT_369397 [Halteromyces radiatus]|uniref:uncharacterized protein n=1 Tax=Halteromyces radiatus TaxID=101107 RepID=UPI00221FDEBB|nr:uncharacterized protein BX664DRAFT_369397 [Halteromyces radiatus]KAI8077737.1 hypothetical protein BX664DRAFT_369397 [Halteromyces radiatus]
MVRAQRLANCIKCLLFTTTCIIASFGLLFLIVAILGSTNIMKGALVFPPYMFPLCGMLGIIITTVATLEFISMQYQRKWVTFVIITLVIVAIILQIVMGIIFEQKEQNPFEYMTNEWHQRDDTFKNHLQEEFGCCGYANVFDDVVHSDSCPINRVLYQDPCFYALTSYIDNHFYKVHVFLLSTLAIDFIALLNIFTLKYLLNKKVPSHQEQPKIGHTSLNDTIFFSPSNYKDEEYASCIENFQQKCL